MNSLLAGCNWGVFSPIFPLHSSNSRWNSKEPWLYRSEYEKVMTDFIKLRHRLMPSLYTCNVLGSIDDEPLVQPMYWIYRLRSGILVSQPVIFGSKLLVAPIVEPRSKVTNLGAVKAWLPPGPSFVDIFIGVVYDANRQITFHRRLEEYPVLAREGTILPMDASSAPRDGCLNPEAFEFIIVVGRDAEARVVEDTGDDGSSSPASKGQQRRMTICFDQAQGKLTAESIDRPSQFRFLSLATVPDALKVYCDGVDRTEDFKVTVEAGPRSPGLLVECSFTDGEHRITIELGPEPQLSVIDPTPSLEHLILDYQCEFEIKDRLWEVVTDRTKPLNAVIGALVSLGYEDCIVGPVSEQLLADSRLHSSSASKVT